MRHVKEQLLTHEFIRRSSAEENEYENKKHKFTYISINKHVDTIGVQLLHSHVHSNGLSDRSDYDNSDCDYDPTSTATIYIEWSQLLGFFIDSVNYMPELFDPHPIVKHTHSTKNVSTNWLTRFSFVKTINFTTIGFFICKAPQT